MYVLEIDGMISTGTADTVAKAVEEAESGGYEALLIELNTDGGLVSSTREINQEISNADVPVVTYVTPRGGRAFSAGTYILMNGHVAAMSPQTQIGAATPIQMGVRGEPNPAERKVMNAMAEYLEDIARTRDLNETRAREYVLNGSTDGADGALDRGTVDLVAGSESELLEAVDGRTVELKGRNATLDTAGASLDRHVPTLADRFRSVTSNPQVVFVLFTVGLLALWFGIQNPGFGAEIVGAVALILALYGMGTFSSSVLALALIGLSALLFVAELVTPTFGVLAAAGIVTLVLGGILLPTEPLMPRNWYGQFALTVAGVSIGLGGFSLYVAWKVLGAARSPSLIREKLLVGSTGRVAERIPAEGEGKVRARGSLWTATADREIPEGAEVLVTDMDGLTAVVEPVE